MDQARPPRVALLLSLYSLHGVALGSTLEYGRSRGWLMHVEAREMRDHSALVAWRPDGVIARVASSELEAELHLLKVPVVNLSSWSADVRLPRVATDDVRAGRLAAEHFLDRGFRRFAYLGSGSTLLGHRRWEGFAGRLAEEGVEVKNHSLEWPDDGSASDTWTATHDRLTRLVRSLEEATALFAMNDDIALRVLDAAHDAGRAVPDQLAVLGVDNTPPVCDHALPPLSSIEQDAQQLGLVAAKTLERLLAGEAVPDEQLIAPRRVVQRASTDVIAVEDDLVKATLRRIREEAVNGLTVAQLLTDVACSRRPFEKRFRKAVGRSPLEEIHRQRIQQACHLLSETERPITGIALECGFSDVSRFGIVFRKLTGTSAQRYRQRHRLSAG